jgi:hypothetical protein
MSLNELARRLLRRGPTMPRRYPAPDLDGPKPDLPATVRGDHLHVTIQIQVEGAISSWADARGVCVEQARRDFKDAIHTAFVERVFHHVVEDLGAALGEERLPSLAGKVV